MIIKSKGIASGDGPRITSYAVAQADNEGVDVLQNENELLLISDEFASAKGRKNGLLHITISPDQELTSCELHQAIEAINAEFQFNPNDSQTLARHLSRRADGTLQDHYHLIRPAQDSETGRTYKLFRSKAKDEAVSRLCELKFGHQLISGANNSFAEMRLREQGHDRLADRLAEAFSDLETPRAAFSSHDHQAAKRQGFDLPGLRQSLKELADLNRSEQPRALAELINGMGLELQDAVVKGRGRSRINIELANGLKPHNVNRTLKIRAENVASFVNKTKEILHDIRLEKTAEPRSDLAGFTVADHPRSVRNSSQQSGNDLAHEYTSEDFPFYYKELIAESQELVAAAEDLSLEATKLTNSNSVSLNSTVLEPNPDINDPNLMRKLAMILKRQLENTAALVRKLQGGGRPASFAPKVY